MYRVIICIILFDSLGVNSTSKEHLRIINGKNANSGDLPYQVSLQWSSGAHICGGTIISNYYVVTAAHCLVKPNHKVRISAGSAHVAKGRQIRWSEKIINHEKFQRKTLEHDITLIRVNNPFHFDKYVLSVTLPTPNYPALDRETAIVSGWGETQDGSNDKKTYILKQAEVTIVNIKKCQQIYAEKKMSLFETNICAHGQIKRTGQCYGDSGGPLVHSDVLIGIVSWSQKDPLCASTKYPGVYTRVSSYTDWILKNVVNDTLYIPGYAYLYQGKTMS